MAIVIAFALLVLAGVGSWALFARADPTNAEPGRLIAAESIVDLGSVPFDRQMNALFTLENTGAQTVRLVGAPTVKTLEGC